MTPDQPSASGSGRMRLVSTALALVSVSVGFGVMSGTVSVLAGLGAHSLGVFAVGLGVLADVTGSAVLVWRFLVERRRPADSRAGEAPAAIVVAAALAVVSVLLVTQSVIALASGTRPGTSRVALVAAGISFVVLAPLAYAKRRLGRQMASRALQGDGTLSAIGAATSLLALSALVLYHALGWWWADRVVALIIAVVAAAEARRTFPRRPPARDG